jgi:hypothetical protein
VSTLIATLSGIYVVGLLVKNVVDAIDQKVEWEGNPNQDWDDFPGP